MTDENREVIIDVTGLSKSFGSHLVVDKVNLKIEKGDVIGFLGPNGSGKTTTLRMLCGLLKADAGQGKCLGFDILTQSHLIKEHVGYMTQKFSLYTDLTIEENLSFIARVFGVKDYKQKVVEYLDRLGLTNNKNQLAGELSGGWKQRLALACCLIHQPALLLLDEPTSGVDPMARREFWDQIHSLSEQGVTSFVSTHYMDEAERCTRIVYLAYGKILTSGTVNEVIQGTGLKTWELSGLEVDTALLQKAKHIKGVVQSALIANKIHVCGYKVEAIEAHLQTFAKLYNVQWQAIPTNLEDAFISLVNQSKEPILV